MTVIAVETPRQADVERLLRLGEEFALSLYPPESCYLLDIGELEAPEVTVFVARKTGHAIGMAALVKRGDGTAELKRLFVEDQARGQKVASQLLAAAEDYARQSGASTLQLETGPRSTAALALYTRSGYRKIANFGQYVDDPFSVCMEKSL